jgi:hypothetical protein
MQTHDSSSKDRLRKILGSSGSEAASPPAPIPEPKAQTPVNHSPAPSPATPEPSKQSSSTSLPAIQSASTKRASAGEVRVSMHELRGKMTRLSDDFARGEINRMQFEAIYKHYQGQMQLLENISYEEPNSKAWQGAITQGLTSRLRERHAAQVLSYAIYENVSGMPLATVGTFNIDTSLLVPMLSSFRSATAEMFGASLRSTEIEGGRWLCFVPGPCTTLIVLFSIEPARLQLTLIEDLHRDFEVANAPAFANGEAEEAAQSFTRIWTLDASANRASAL